MALEIARALAASLAVYAGIGAVFALAFVLFGAARIDPAARSAGFGFRVLIFPASAALWPVLLLRWRSGRREPPLERTAHREAAEERA